MHKFRLIPTGTSGARAGKLTTKHGEVPTPVFLPVGSQGTVKTLTPAEIKDIGFKMVLANTYHLYLRPGIEVVKEMGGLHNFMAWDGAILTDSGGYQVFSLAPLRRVTDDGVTFQSHIDGSRHLFTPEGVMDIQRVIGADIIMAFDECTPYPCDYNYAKRSMHMTHRWLERCITRLSETEPHYGYEQTFFPIIQGSTYKDLRLQSAEYIAGTNQLANAIGGLSVGEPAEEMYAMTEVVCSVLPEDKPRYLMGVGTPANILENIALGIDMFDCVMPTRNGRNGMLFTKQGIINIKNKKWEADFSKIDEFSDAHVARFHTKAYLRHLFISKERLGGQIASINNLSFYMWLVTEARKQILEGTFYEWKKTILKTIMQRL